MENIIEKAREWALEETRKNGTPILIHLNFSLEKAVELANKLKADKNLVRLGALLMDIKLGEARNNNMSDKHVEMSVNATKNFLTRFDLSTEVGDKILNCVGAHHSKIPFECLEAEICANADCYRFVHPKGVFAYLELLGSRGENLSDSLDKIENKLDEKWNILSLDICKKELAPYYHQFKELFKIARE